MNILKTIQEHMLAHPEQTAFSFRNGSISYGQLWEMSGRLAVWLHSGRVKPHQPVPVYGHKNKWMPVCFLACVRAGLPYVPMDTNMPENRIHDIVSAVAGPLILETQPASFCWDEEKPDEKASAAQHLQVQVIGTDQMEKILQETENNSGVEKNTLRPDQPDPSWADAREDVLYIIFTSGSTGKPKGVPITRGNLENYLDFSVRMVKNKKGVFMNQAPWSFDLSVMDTWTGLATGSEVACIDRDMISDPKAIQAFLLEKKVTYWVSTPSFAELCLGNPAFAGENLPDLQHFLFCGETLKKNVAGRLMDRFPKAEVVNTYGPTETTVCVTETAVTREMMEKEEILPVGFPKRGTHIYAADPENRQRLGAGEKGELIITGDTVSPGYFHNEEQTKAHFFTDETGERAYRTGDLGWVAKNGMIYVSGRSDGQIKLHGYRIELGDIEHNLARLEGVIGACVFPEEKDGQISSLAACILQSPETDTSYARRKWIRTALGRMLPSYMVPKRIKFFTEFPMTMNGKLDKKALRGML